MDRHAKKHGERAAVLKFMGMDGLNRLDAIIRQKKAELKETRESEFAAGKRHWVNPAGSREIEQDAVKLVKQ